MNNVKLQAGTNAHNGINVGVTSSSQTIAKPIVIRLVCVCGNKLTEKELFYETCLQCGETPTQTDV
jgi:hypothetical protein